MINWILRRNKTVDVQVEIEDVRLAEIRKANMQLYERKKELAILRSRCTKIAYAIYRAMGCPELVKRGGYLWDDRSYHADDAWPSRARHASFEELERFIGNVESGMMDRIAKELNEEIKPCGELIARAEAITPSISLQDSLLLRPANHVDEQLLLRPAK